MPHPTVRSALGYAGPPAGRLVAWSAAPSAARAGAMARPAAGRFTSWRSC